MSPAVDHRVESGHAFGRLQDLARGHRELIARCSQPPEPANVITETVGNDGSNRPGCSPGSPLQAEAAGIIREAQDFCRQYESPEKLAKYPAASLVLRLAHALKQLADELDRRCPHDPDYEHNAAEVAKAHQQWREAAAIPAFCKAPDFATWAPDFSPNLPTLEKDMKATVTQEDTGLRFEIEDDGSEDFRKAVQFTCVNNPLRLTPEQRLAIDWAASLAREQSQVAIHKTLRAMLGDAG